MNTVEEDSICLFVEQKIRKRNQKRLQEEQVYLWANVETNEENVDNKSEKLVKGSKKTKIIEKKVLKWENLDNR